MRIRYLKDVACPECGWKSKVEYNPHKNLYTCHNCSHKWPKEKKVVREKIYRCPSCGHQWDEEQILMVDHLKTVEK